LQEVRAEGYALIAAGVRTQGWFVCKVFAKTSKDAFYSHLLRNAININTDKVKAPYLPSFLATLLAVLID